MEDNLPEVIGLFRCESEGDIKWSDDTTNSLAVYTRTPAKQSTPDELREAIKTVRQFISITSDSLTNHAEIQAIETLIHHATRADGGEVVTEHQLEVKLAEDFEGARPVWHVVKYLSKAYPNGLRIVKGGA